MNRALAFSLFTLGVTSVVGQVVLVRELTIIFYGNEFFIGWTLFSWLLWVALGSSLANLLRSVRKSEHLLVAGHALAAAVFPGTVALARYSRVLSGAMPGELPNLLPALGFAFLAPAPWCVLLGAQFVAAARLWTAADESETARVVGRSYLCETAGFVAGGLAFSFLLVPLNEFRVAGLVGWLNALAGGGVHAFSRRKTFPRRVAVIAASALATVVFFLARDLNALTARWRFPAQQLVASRNTLHGNVAVTRLGSQYNFFVNGLLLGADREQMGAEQLAHFPLLYHPAPRRVLLIGGGFNGALTEILKHRPERVDYLELDPRLVGIARGYLADDLQKALDDPRVNVIHADGRLFLRQRGEAVYDVVLVNLSGPSTAMINRYFSREFFAEALGRLAPGGLCASQFAFAPDYLSPEMEDLGASVFKAAAGVFPSLIALPEYSLILIGSAGAPLEYDPGLLVRRMQERGITNDFVVPAYIEFRLTTDRIPRALSAFELNRTAPANRDLRPVACWFNQLYWISSFHPRIARAAGAVGRRTGAIVAALLAVALGAAWAARRRDGGAALLAKGAGSLSVLACEVLLVLAFQVFRGYVYHKLALLIAALMTGMAAGTWLADRSPGHLARAVLFRVHLLFAAYAGLVLVAARWLSLTAPPPLLVELAFLLFAAALGTLAGYEFPAANRLYLESRSRQGGIGTVYVVDLLGSCVGALLIGVWLLPVLGMAWTLAALAALNGIVALALRRQA